MMTDRARSLVLWHLAEMKALLKRMEPDHIARPLLQQRITELETDLAEHS